MSREADHSVEAAWHNHAQELHHFARHRLGDGSAAEDLVQEAFLRLHRTTTWPENVRSWLFQVVRNLIIDQWRNKVADAPLPDELPIDEAQDTEQVRAELGACLPQLLENIPETYREALRLVDLEEQPHQVLATRLSLSLSGAKSRVQRGRRLMGKVLAQCCLFDKDHAGRVIGFTPKTKNSCVLSSKATSSSADNNQQEQSAMKQVVIEWSHLEVAGETCERCGDTGAELRNAISSLNQECLARGVYFELRDTALDAAALNQSNAIYIDGRPIEALLPQVEVGSSDCSSCGTLIGESGAECRTLEGGDTVYETIPAALIREAACKAVACCAPVCGCH